MPHVLPDGGYSIEQRPQSDGLCHDARLRIMSASNCRLVGWYLTYHSTTDALVEYIVLSV